MPLTAQPSTSVLTSSELGVLEEFLEEMNALDCQQATLTDRKTTLRKAHSKRATERSTKPYKNPNPVWKRRKEELQSLRLETQALETKVAFLRLRETHAKLFDEYMGTTKGQERWKTAAKSEREKYEQSQTKNAQLKLTLKRCQKTCDSLQAALKMTDIKDLELMINAKSLYNEMKIGDQLRLLSAALFSTLECRVQARLQELDTLLRDNRAVMAEGDTDQVQVYQQDCLNSTSVVEFTRTRLMPFSAEETSTIAWDIMKLGGFPNEQLTFGHSEEDEMVSEAWSSHSLKCGGSATLRSHCLKKRVAIPGGFAVLVEAISEWLAYPISAAPWRYVTRDAGLAVVYTLETSRSSDMCRVQSLLRLTTADSNEAGSCHQHIAQTQLTSAVSEVVIPSFQEMMQSKHQLLENTVLDSSRASAACNSFE
ncbi:hypothetical protein PC129_g7030 [Phytophthora cactorum]|nr:hypothetical protein PC115_g8077 [Phytophthora cactorum]KAG3036784.1 hypothetical protein PC119_g4154 [Phytophthora cactorum]KAG3199279.1 hypothetical protein PC128_g5403 [Phytophthora cactorum]KAG3222268.1 hypothetical protein PC129_g7030 [Phytophthora cactorum]